VTRPPGAARDVVRRLLASGPTLAGGRLLCVDGPAGSGKTTLAQAVLSLWPAERTSHLVQLDDIYPGWSGLDEAVVRVAALLDALRDGRPGRYRRYDWHAGAEADWCEVEPVDLIVVEGVGAGALDWDRLISVLVWVEAPAELRLARGTARDAALAGRLTPDDALRAHWLQWSLDEQAHFARNRTRARADLLVDGVSGAAVEGAASDGAAVKASDQPTGGRTRE
jgi:uridine kinase